MHLYARIVLTAAATCIALGGAYDVFAPALPSNLRNICAGNREAERTMRELLRALGGSLMAVGVAIAVLALRFGRERDPATLWLIAALVLPAEGMNVIGMYRARSPWPVPLAFLLLTLVGVALGMMA